MAFAPKTLALAALIALGGVAAQAQTSPAAAPASGPHTTMHEKIHEKMRAHSQERMQKRLDAFKQKLQVTPQQEGAWNGWVAAMKPAERQRPNREEFAHMTTPERIDRMKQMRAQRSAEQDKRADATKALYGQLNAQQQKMFDEASLKMMAHRRGHFAHHG